MEKLAHFKAQAMPPKVYIVLAWTALCFHAMKLPFARSAKRQSGK